MLQRERQRRVRLGIELEADALLSISGVQAYSIALKRAEEASSDEMVRDWSVVAATVARKSGVRSSLLDALFGLARRMMRPSRQRGPLRIQFNSFAKASAKDRCLRTADGGSRREAVATSDTEGWLARSTV